MKEVCTTCERCQRAKTPKEKNKGPLTHIITPARPMYQLSIDFLAIDTKAQTKCKILTCVDEFTKYAFCILVKSENATKTAEALYHNIYTKFGIPEVVHSDQGATFISKVLAELNTMLGITHTVTTTYRPQSNGSCERLNSTIISRIRTLHTREKTKWYFHIDSLVMAYNTTVHESTGLSPFSAMYGRHPKIPIDLLVHLPDQYDHTTVPVKTFVKDREKELKEAYQLMKDNIDKRRARSKRNFDDKLKKSTDFNNGDKVLVRKFVQKNKVDDRFQAEIYVIISKKDDVPLYLVQGLESGTIKSIHRDHLILFHQSAPSKPITTVNDIITWDIMQHKHYNTDEDEDWLIKKKFNNRIAIHFGESNDIATDYRLEISSIISSNDMITNLKTARDNGITTAIICIAHNNRENLKTIIQSICQEIAHKSWNKIIISTEQHVIYNVLIELMCTYFPKTVMHTEQSLLSESDDDSDSEYITHQQHQPVVPDDSVNDHSEDSEDNENDAACQERESSTDSDSEPEQEARHGYNLRRAGRRPPVRYKDYVTYTLCSK